MTKYRTKAILNIRGGPGTKYPVVGSIGKDYEFPPLDTAGWLPVELEDNTIGWLSLEYLEEVQPPPEVVPPEEPPPEIISPIPAVEEAPTPPAEVSEYNFDTKEGTIEAIKAECIKQGLGLKAQIAYVLATTEWESGRTFKPVKEAYWMSENWRRQHLRYYPYYGRGYVQLTWESNYDGYTSRLRARFPGEDIDLLNNPDQAMVPKYALFILVDGFKTGAFTGKKLEDFVNEADTDFIEARTCINGHDKAEELAGLAKGYLDELA